MEDEFRHVVQPQNMQEVVKKEVIKLLDAGFIFSISDSAWTIIFSDHAALRYLVTKKDVKPLLLRWNILLQEFDIEIKDKRGAENVAADHLSRLENSDLDRTREQGIGDDFPGETLLYVKTSDEGFPRFADLANYLSTGELVPGQTYQ
ncbi:uncharacterized protein LOC143590929 [Bidens hawaiensis]|uniref:uncharacterized protein LOC143590929 n=1 Tax=Bidens hawaiensis TaxID=980011 RepID=UPI004049529C